MLVDAFGRSYELLRLLGQGGFGEVHLARVRSPGGLEQHVAVKLLHRGLDPRGQAVERLRDEARLLASLRHPVVLTAHDFVELGGKVALITEFIEGEDLAACIDPQGPRGRMPATTLLEVVERVASALDAAYLQLHVVHRDVKPANIRIGSHGTVKLLDFGVARSNLEDRSAQTGSQMVVGTLRYLAPERFDPKQALEPASDVFSLGCVLYEGVTGETFFGTLRMPEMVRLSISPEGWTEFVERRLGEVQSSPVAEELRGLLAGMLAYDVEARPAAGEVARRCEELTSRAPGHVRLTRWCRDRSWPPSPIGSRSTTPLAAAPPQTPARRAFEEGTPKHVGSPPLTNDPALGAAPNALVTTESLVRELVGRSGPTREVSRSTPDPQFPWGRWAAAMTAVGGVSAAIGVALVGAVIITLVLQGGSEEVAPSSPTVVPAPVPPAPSPDVPPVAAPVVEDAPVPSPVPSSRPPRPTVAAPTHALPEPAPAEVALPAPAAPEPPPLVHVAATRRITVASVPGGAEIWLVATGELLGTTPLVRPLSMGDVAVRLRAPDGASTERTLKVSPDGPARYVWHIAENRFDAGN